MTEQIERPIAQLSQLEDLRDAADIASGYPRIDPAVSAAGADAPSPRSGGHGWTVHTAPIDTNLAGTHVALVLTPRYLAQLGQTRRVRGRNITVVDTGRVTRGSGWDPVPGPL